jgi:uncharacterized paraquat-inducible protein A
MHPKIVMHCPGCNARITAPVELQGKRRHCPRCATGFLVGPRTFLARARRPEDSDPLLVAADAPRAAK